MTPLSSGEVGWIVKSSVKCLANLCLRTLRLHRSICLLILISVLSSVVFGQTFDSDSPVPILTGNAGYFTNVQGGKVTLVPEVNPVLLLPLGQRWLVEARGEFEGDFERRNGNGPFGG